MFDWSATPLAGRRARVCCRYRAHGVVAVLAAMHFAKRASRTSRSVREFVRGLAHTSHPLLVHIIPTRRCNIDCAYCHEYDQVSQPIPLETMYEQIDRLAMLGASVAAMSGGRTDAASESGSDPPPRAGSRDDRGADHERLSVVTEEDRQAQRCRVGLPADQYRQRRAR